MNQNWLEVFNSATTFGILTAIAIGVWFLVMKKTLLPLDLQENLTLTHPVCEIFDYLPSFISSFALRITRA
ncbi:MAG: hypothetical protein A2784_04460 [Candidatus Chisholmbacteria bacterium RIFCSPHIGHO2_01_FULL_48_12]|uniref:Uncharacterized protein n=1 Tax=Candidatus Chisholmbacteria bacterium RIFCSPHIGHO2_01_FULL_48_12 TaxID=1797589 RepID=A0A1G1VK56_9BACT|nr:MAG: hypothetical protein A2784_04460 [Candidatus Chisholmbacteria bacterium RIFCSPHIGHO2_01_FULL_48_12]